MNIALVWDNANSRADWQVLGGRITTGNLLQTAVLLSWFTDRRAAPDYLPNDGSTDLRGWWEDSFDGILIGSRLWQLRRRKIADRNLLMADAKDMLDESTAWMPTAGLVSSVTHTVQSSGSNLSFIGTFAQPSGPSTIVRALWSTV